ncbi:MAG: glycosyltransferase family 2 protein, partial [Bacteroidetes bacterium]
MQKDATFFDYIRWFYEGFVFFYGTSMLLVYGMLAVLSFIAIRLHQKKSTYVDYTKLIESSLAPGISVIAPAFNESVTII